MSVRTGRRVRTTAFGVAVAAGITATVCAAGPASAREAAPASHRATQQAMDAAVRDGVPGVVGIAQQDGRTWSGDSGVADLRTGRERQAEDRYRVGSITKTFVATVALQLEAEGRLSLDDTVEHWLPGVVRGNGHDGTKIALRQLLNHTSGIYNYTQDKAFGQRIFSTEFLQHRYDTYAPQRLVDIAMGHAPEFEPGTSWRYSNTNFVLAGMVIEKATGHSYATEIERRILRPLHLRSTTLPGTDSRMPRPSGRAYSKLSEKTTGRTYDVTALNPSMASSAGEMVSDSGDLNRFYRALLTGELLPRRQLAEMKTTVAMPGAPGAGYGLGLAARKLPCGVEVWGHDGGIHGSTSVAVTTEDGRHSLAYNLNSDWADDGGAVMLAEFCGTAPAVKPVKPVALVK
ncbi:serine hydrolase domain-containing protein [Streptomyces sp. BPTC-684]|uniref:serine hydrolase domain-containing protein n=1 Tax=Streptomyces sp. BPTC-684 TaxID=3043734 RepID=UPI0024B0516E|nr:serine hydrolase domain-containing protein [Streptomyces sp. BPTC-684]WHM38716.1 serine hydrolase domain-containing protein [Streptomyces sp. BPTC-684]